MLKILESSNQQNQNSLAFPKNFAQVTFNKLLAVFSTKENLLYFPLNNKSKVF